MGDPVRFSVSPHYLPVLGRYVPGEKSLLSPFRLGTKETVTSPLGNFLARMGLADEDGTLKPGPRRTLKVLSETGAFARAFVAECPNPFEEAVYFAQDGGPPVLLTTRSQEVHVEDPACVDEALTDLRQQIGASTLRGFDLEVTVPREDALVFAALLDALRRLRLWALIENTEVQETPFSTDFLHRTITETPPRFQWLVYAVRGMDAEEGRAAPEAVRASLERLAKNGQLASSGEGYVPAERLQAAADRMLVVDKVLRVEAGRITQSGKVVNGGFFCFQSGVTSLLQVERNEEDVTFRSVSAVDVLKSSERFLTDQDALKALADRLEASAPSRQFFEETQALLPLNLLVVDGPKPGKVYTLARTGTIGRMPDNALALEDPHVSRHHARFVQEEDGFWSVEDLKSANGTIMNNSPISGPMRLKDGDVLGIGSAVFKVYLGQVPAE